MVTNIRDALERAADSPEGVALERLRQMEQMLATFDLLAGKLLSSETQARAVISFFMDKA